MKIRLGDKVRFVNENLEGTVTRLDGNLAGVTIGEDFEIPVPISDIVKISGMHREPQAETKDDEAPPALSRASVHPGLYLAFVRLNDTLLDLQLHNNLWDDMQFAFSEQTAEGYTTRKMGRLAGGATVSIGTYDLEQFSRWTVFHLHAIPSVQRAKDLPVPVNRRLQMRSKEFHAAFRHTFFLGSQAYLFRIDMADEPDAASLTRLLSKDFSEPVSSPSLPSGKPQPVVDLHIEKLTEEKEKMTAADMIALQMDIFTKTLDMAIVHGMKNIIFIHGAGNHFLKNRIRNYLTQQKGRIEAWKDADMLKYGGGATEVELP